MKIERNKRQFVAEDLVTANSTNVDAITVAIDYTDGAAARRRGIFTSRATLRTI